MDNLRSISSRSKPATYVDDATPVVFTIDSAFSGVVLGDTIMVKSAKWTGFCNPLFDANPLPDLTPLISTSAVFTDAPFDVDVVMGDGNAVQSGFFDFEITPESGLVRWFGNTLIGQKDSSQALVVDQVGPELITASEPLAPYDTKLTWQGILLGSTNFISEQDAETLTSGVLNASGLHLHDDIYRRLDQTLDHNSDLVGIQGGNPPSEAYHLTSTELGFLQTLITNPPGMVFLPSPITITVSTSVSSWTSITHSNYGIPSNAAIYARGQIGTSSFDGSGAGILLRSAPTTVPVNEDYFVFAGVANSAAATSGSDYSVNDGFLITRDGTYQNQVYVTANGGGIFGQRVIILGYYVFQ